MYCPGRFGELATIEQEVNDLNGAFLSVCTQGYSSTSIDVAYNYLSQYFEGSFMTGTAMPADCNILGVPFTAIIDLETGKVVLRDVNGQMATEAILTYVEFANDN